MRKSVFSLLCASLLLACSDSTQVTLEKTTKEVLHLNKSHFAFDSSLVNNKDTLDFELALKAIPNHFVMTHVETDSFIEAHIYEDLAILIRQNKDSLFITKDSLLQFVNEAYLNEALIEDINLMVFEPSRPLYLVEFAVRKPNEDFRFHFQAMIEGESLLISIVDE